MYVFFSDCVLYGHQLFYLWWLLKEPLCCCCFSTGQFTIWWITLVRTAQGKTGLVDQDNLTENEKEKKLISTKCILIRNNNKKMGLIFTWSILMGLISAGFPVPCLGNQLFVCGVAPSMVFFYHRLASLWPIPDIIIFPLQLVKYSMNGFYTLFPHQTKSNFPFVHPAYHVVF